MQVYGDSKSGNCLKVKWVAAHLGKPAEWIEIDITKGESRTPEFLAMNPAGQVPTVVLDDGRTLAQSNAIILHLAEGSALIPADAYDRARMYEWLFWEQYSHEPYVAVARFRVVYDGVAIADLDPALVKRANAAIARLETGLSASPFLVGDALSLADVALVAYTRLAPEAGIDLGAYPRVQAWVARVEEALSL